MKKDFCMTGFFFLAVVLMGVVREVQLADAATCDPNEMQVCFWAYTMSAMPSLACCNRVRQHRSCYCQYKNNPKFQSYLQSPATKKITSSCGVTIPSC